MCEILDHNNLILYNVEEDSLNPETKVRRILKSMDIDDANDMLFDYLHHLGPLVRNGIKLDQLYSDWFATLTVIVYEKLGGS